MVSMLGLAACGSGGGGNAASHPAAATVLVDDFSSGSVSGQKWDNGQYRAVLANGDALLSEKITSAQPLTSHNGSLVVVPTGGGEVTTLQADIDASALTATGDTQARAGIELIFQPLADRGSRGNANTNALFARIVLQAVAGGAPVALRQLFECTAPDCSTSANPPTGVIGNWSGSTPPTVVLGTTYTIGISVNTTTKVFTYTLSGGTFTAGAALSETINAATWAASGTPPPFPVDLTPANFLRARLFVSARGQAAGGGDGTATATFDNVSVGVNGGAAAHFDDFSTGTSFDNSKWTVGGESFQVSGAALQASLAQKDTVVTGSLALANAVPSALQADVTVTAASQPVGGLIAAVLQRSLYNDGSKGTGAAPDVNGPNSYVGDLRATIGMSGTDVKYAVARCNDALCNTVTFAQPYTSIGTVTLNVPHTLYLDWDDGAHKLWVRLDGGTAVSFDPVAAGFAKAAAPSLPLLRIGVRAGDAGPTDHFASGSSGTLTANFTNVKTN